MKLKGKIMVGIAAVSAALWLVTVAADARQSPAPIAFTHVSVADVVAGTIVPDMTVLVDGNRIGQIGKTEAVRLPSGARVVDAAGKFLLPGLWDMHVHTLAGRRDGWWVRSMLVVNGVTGVREMGGDGVSELTAARHAQAADGTLLPSPRFAVASLMINGRRDPSTSNPRSRLTAATPDEGRRAVDAIVAAGADFVKVHNNIPPETYRTILGYAQQRGLTVAGHVPYTVDVREASDLRQRSIEHMTGIPVACSSDEDGLRRTIAAINDSLYGGAERMDDALFPRAMATFDSSKCAAVARRFARNGTWLAPTLVVFEPARFEREAGRVVSPLQRYIPASLKVRGAPYGPRVDRTPEAIAQREQFFTQLLRMMAIMHREGVELLAGTDAPFFHIYHGFSLHDELAIFVRAGLTPAQALRTATINPARFLGKDKELGSIETGKLADLVLLEANPLADIRNTARIDAVVLDGRLLERAALDRVRADIEANAQR